MTAVGDWSHRAADVARAWALWRRAAAHEQLPQPDLRALQLTRLRCLVEWAVQASPFYRDLYAGVDPRAVELEALPPVNKGLLTEYFDEVVTDPRLKAREFRRHLLEPSSASLHLGDYRVLATAGTTGEPALYLYSGTEWVVAMAGVLRANELAGLRPRLPRRRVATVGSTSPLHVSASLGRTFDVGLHHLLRLDVRRPFDQLLRALQIFQPEVLVGYSSALALLARAQADGELVIAPGTVATTGEVRTVEAEAAITRAWGKRPHSLYGITEGGILAGDCRERRGMHLFEDWFWVENVDDSGNPVPDGALGTALLVTNLFNRTQPLIRYRLDDMAVIESGPCPCGRRFRRVVQLEGRSADILRLPGRLGGEVPVHPGAVRRPFATMADVRQYQIVYERSGLHVRVVPAPATPTSVTVERVGDAVRKALEEAGAQPPPIRVEVVGSITRNGNHGAKLSMIQSAAVAGATAAPKP